MQSFKVGVENETLFDGEFWKVASHLYYKPTSLFLHASQLWKIIYRNSVDANEFLEYYKTFIGAIDVEKIDHRSQVIRYGTLILIMHYKGQNLLRNTHIQLWH
ncbi:hypothetical protein [Winogradskyella sp.]|uniref:hypothetical protein n=1 Tax=Winogradskyella sp. TaxID=1883156 RepID=UPI0025D5F5AD|nr:hypothetical protein [Winogradskyella sp.]